MKTALLFLALFCSSAMAQMPPSILPLNGAPPPTFQTPNYGYSPFMNQGFNQVPATLPYYGAPNPGFYPNPGMYQSASMFQNAGPYPNPGFYPNQRFYPQPMQQWNPYASMYGQNQPGIHLGLNFDLASLFGGNSPLGNLSSDGQAPYCEACERARRQREQIDYSHEDDDLARSDYHTEARVQYVRQPELPPAPHVVEGSAPAVVQIAQADDREQSGEHIASGEPQLAPLPPPPQVLQTQQLQRPPPAVLPALTEPAPNFAATLSVTQFHSSRPPTQVIFSVRAGDKDERRAQTAPIWNSFIHNFQQCVPAGCQPAQYAAYGERGNNSCHPQGKAIDVGAMNCNGTIIKAIDSERADPRFRNMVACMKTKMKWLWHQNKGRGPTLDHWNHVHFSNGCLVNGHGVY